MPVDDKTLKTICVEFRKGLLGRRSSYLQCAKVSYALQGYLSFAGLETYICEGELDNGNHVWLEMLDGRVIDCTADQFNTRNKKYPKVYIGEPLDIHPGAGKRRARRKTIA